MALGFGLGFFTELNKQEDEKRKLAAETALVTQKAQVTEDARVRALLEKRQYDENLFTTRQDEQREFDRGEETRKRVRRLSNCTQIFREPYAITGTAMAAKHYGGSELARLQARKLAKIKSDIEFAMLTNGDISLDATSENPKRTMAGFGIGGSAGTGFVKSLDGRDNTNLQADFDDADMDQFDAVVEYIFSDTMEGSMEKTVLCSNKWLRFITSLGRQGVGPTGTPVASNGASINVNSGDANATAGLRVTSYQGPVGVLNFIPHPMLKGAYEDFALAVDMANVDLRPLASRDMQL